MSIKEMRKLYHSPMTSQAHSRMECWPREGCPHYDVPGAFLTVCNSATYRFPTLYAVERCIMRERAELTIQQARCWAHDIYMANNTGDFLAAWLLLANLVGEDLSGGPDGNE